MEFSPELAVLQSAVRFAQSKFGCPLDITTPSEVKQFVGVLAPTIDEIIKGLETDRNELDRNVWSFKIVSILFTHCLKKLFNGNVKDGQDTQTTNQGAETLSSSDELEKEDLEKINDCHIFETIPCLSFQIFLEIVKRFNWNDMFLECLEVIEVSKAVMVISSIQEVVSHWSKDGALLSIVVTCLKYLCWLVVQTANENVALDLKVMESLADLTKWCHDQVDHNTKENMELKMYTKDLTHLIVVFAILSVKDQGLDKEYILKELSMESKQECPDYRETTKILQILQKRRHLKCKQTIDVFRKHVIQTISTSKWLQLILRIVKQLEQKTISDSTKESLCELLSRNMTLDIGLVDIHLKPLYTSLLKILKEHKIQSVTDDEVSLLIQFLESVEVECLQQDEILSAKVKAEQAKITLQEKLTNRLPGFEECLEEIVTCCDVSRWQVERYAEVLTSNSDLLCSDSHVRRLHSTLKAMTSKEQDRTPLQPILQLLYVTFSKLPILSQERIILDNFLSEDSNLLAEIGNFHQDINIAFNQFTSEASKKQLKRVLWLCLLDPMTVIQKTVATAVKSPGQIPIILKILQSIPDLCRQPYVNHHSERSLLCHVTTHFLLESTLQHKEEKNFIKFLSLTVQNFTREVCGRKLPEDQVMSPAEFAASAILPFIGLPGSHDQPQPIGIELSLKLFLCLLEEKGCDWLVDLQLQTVLLCICELLHECVELWDSCGHMINKCSVKQLCVKCLHLLQTKGKVVFLDTQAGDWLKSRTKCLDWSVLVHLQKTLCCLQQGDNSEYSVLLEKLAGYVVDSSGVTCLTLLRFVGLNDDTLEAVRTRIRGTDRVISHDVLSTSVAHLAPNLLVSEWKRVVCFVSELVQMEKLVVPTALVFSHKILMSSSVRSLLGVTQLLTDVVIATADMSTNTVRHIVSCYITSLQEHSNNMVNNKENGSMFLIGQVFGHVTVAMTAVDIDQSEPMFVFLLSLLEKFCDLRDKTTTKRRDISETENVLLKAVALVDERMQETLLKKLFDDLN